MGIDAFPAVHAVCEWLLAGPQYARSSTIQLRVTDTGLATTAAPELELTPVGLQVAGAVVPVTGTVADVAAAAGLPLGRPDVHYRDPVPAGPDTDVTFDPVGFGEILSWYRLGRDALLQFQPDETPVLWPEHMDVAIRHHEVNYGVAPPDSAIGVPYAYVGPGAIDDDPFWNVSFGAAVRVAEFTGEDHSDRVRQIAEFFRQGLARVTG